MTEAARPRRPLAPRARRVALTVAAATSLGCSAPDGGGDPVAVASADAVATVDEVAVAQSEADAALSDVLAELRAADETVRRLRAASSVAAGLEAAAEVRDALGSQDLTAVEGRFARLDQATDAARRAVADAASAADEADDAWSVTYLEAESAVLDAVAAHSEAGRELLDAARPHRDALEEVLGAAVEVEIADPDDGPAAAAAVELEVGAELETLVGAQEATVAATEQRVETAAELNAVSADAAAVAERRPSS